MIGKNGRLPAMEGLRAYAVTLVFFVHSLDAFNRSAFSANLNRIRLKNLNDYLEIINLIMFRSHYGVDLFFLLSGFLIYKVINKKDFKYITFISNRAKRIYPAFLFSFSIYFILRTIITHEIPFDVSTILKNLLFLNGIPGYQKFPLYNHVTWSLFFEFSFYVIMPITYFSLRMNNPYRLIALLVTVFSIGALTNHTFTRYAMFIVGALLASFSKDELKLASHAIPDIAVILIYMLATLTFSFVYSFQKFIPIYSLASSLLFINSVYGTGILNKFFSLNILRYLGNISYSFYLMHLLSIYFSMNFIVAHLNTELTSLRFIIFITSAFFLTIIISSISFLLMEKPYFKRKIST